MILLEIEGRLHYALEKMNDTANDATLFAHSILEKFVDGKLCEPPESTLCELPECDKPAAHHFCQAHFKASFSPQAATAILEKRAQRIAVLEEQLEDAKKLGYVPNREPPQAANVTKVKQGKR